MTQVYCPHLLFQSTFIEYSGHKLKFGDFTQEIETLFRHIKNLVEEIDATVNR